MKPPIQIACLAVLPVVLAMSGRGSAQPIGTDITSLNLCLYGDCEARGSYAGDPWGWANPATMPSLLLDSMPRGAIVEMGYFRLNAGGVAADVESPSFTLAAAPFVLVASPVFAEGEGEARGLPGFDLTLRTRSVRLAAAVDLERALSIPGLSLGLLGEVPGTTTDVRIELGDVVVAKGKENHEVNLTLGAHWRGGRGLWFMAGAFVNAIRNTGSLEVLGVRQHGTTDAWFSRAGLSLLPLVPLGLGDGGSPAAEWLREIRVGSDLEYRNITVADEGGTRTRWTGYFGIDWRLLPDAWNPVSRWVRFYGIAGVDTYGGWGLGGGLVGNGPLAFFACNPGYSSRPLTPVLGERTNIWAATCAVGSGF